MTKRESYSLIALSVIGLALASGCDRIKEWKAQREIEEAAPGTTSPELIYQTTYAELKLAEGKRSYLVFDMNKRALQVRLKGATLLSVPLRIVESDAGSLDRFVGSFVGGKGSLVRPLAGKYLFEAEDQTPDSVLKIVSSVVNVSPDLLQREIPGRFRLFWDDKLILDVVSERPEGETPKPKKGEGDLKERLQGRFENTMMEARYVLRRPFGARLLVIMVTPDEAMTIYRVAEAGAPTLIQLVSTEPAAPAKKAGK